MTRKKNGWQFYVHNNELENVSIVIPVSDQETELEHLLQTLEKTGAEIIISAEGSRAKSLNAGAAKATRYFLWFVHADSRITQHNIESLQLAIKEKPKALHYFKLVFFQAGLSALNAYLANIRSVLFGLPYGDQALCISKQQFARIGGYPEDTPYGEDLLFVRKAKKHQIRLTAIDSFISSSPRKYKTQGWLKTTLRHQVSMVKLLLKKI